MTHPFPKQTQIVQDFYARIPANRPPARKVGWQDDLTQRSRFQQLTNIATFINHSVLDVGCGLGTLNSYLNQQQIDAQYTGIDFHSTFIKTAQSNHPKADFIETDFFDPQFNQDYDYILASGTFNHRVPKQITYIDKAIQKMVQLSRYGVAFNLLSSRTPKPLQQPHTFYYYKPEEILTLCLKYSPYVVFKHHYLPNDMTFYIYKEPVEKASHVEPVLMDQAPEDPNQPKATPLADFPSAINTYT